MSDYSTEDSGVRIVNGRSPSRGSQMYGTLGGGGRFGEEYDELLGGSVPCPSCQGAGRIPKERESEMVALIPLSDKRLKPRRTVLYVIVAVAVCAFLTGLLIFFLFPRSVSLSSSVHTLRPTYLYVNASERYVFLTLVNKYNITNSNFFSVDVTELDVTCNFDGRVVGSASNGTALRIPLRKQKTHEVQMNLTFSGDEGYIAQYCSSPGRVGHTLLLPFQASATVVSMGRTEQNVITTYQQVRCSSRDEL